MVNNRRKDPETGKDMHLFTSDIEFTIRTLSENVSLEAGEDTDTCLD